LSRLSAGPARQQTFESRSAIRICDQEPRQGHNLVGGSHGTSFQSERGSIAGLLRFGVQQVFTELFCLALLQEPSVERVKHVLRSDLGAVMGGSKAACVKTLRRKLDELSQQRQAVRLGTLLARHWIAVGLINASYLYVDGHIKIYGGTRLVPGVWNSHRRMADCGSACSHRTCRFTVVRWLDYAPT